MSIRSRIRAMWRWRRTLHVDLLYVITDVQSTVFIAPVVAELTRRGKRVGLITNTHNRPLPYGLENHLAWHRSLPMRRNPSPLWDLFHLWALVAAMVRLRPTVVHASTPKAGLLGTLAGTITRRPVRIYQLRGLRAEGSSGLSRRLLVTLEKIAMASSSIVVLESNSLRQALDDLGVPAPESSLVIGMGSSIGVDCDRFQPIPKTSPQSPPVLGFIGRLHSDKGLTGLAHTITAVRGLYPEATLEVVGDADPTDPAAPRLIEFLDQTPGIRRLGQLNDVAGVLARWDLFVFPTRREGLPNVPLEAQACGVPLVGYAATGVVDAVHNGVGGVLLPVGDQEGLAKVACEVLADAERWRALSAGGRLFVEKNFARTTVVTAHAYFLVSQIDSGRRRLKSRRGRSRNLS